MGLTGKRGFGYLGHRKAMHAAAGIALVELSCHEDTWNWIQEQFGRQAATEAGWRLMDGSRVRWDGGDHMVTVSLSGSRTVVILSHLRALRRGYLVPEADRAQARRLYEAFAAAVIGIDPDHLGDRTVTIVVDDRLGDEAPHQGQEA